VRKRKRERERKRKRKRETERERERETERERERASQTARSKNVPGTAGGPAACALPLPTLSAWSGCHTTLPIPRNRERKMGRDRERR
jgi:hypothetical protein